MSSISRQYHPQSCSLEITAQTSPLSRWARRPIIKSVNFLLSFQGLSGANHEPLEIRGNQEQLQLLSATVTDYVQSLLGQSLATANVHPSSQFGSSQTHDAATTTATDPMDASSTAPEPYLYSRSLVAHDLILGPLSTNAEHQTVSLKASQLFDLVSALDDCAAELEMLPLDTTPARRPALPVWASSAAAMVLLLGATTATLQLTQQNPTTDREWVTSNNQDPAGPSTSDPASAEVEGLASAPQTPSPPTNSAPLSQPSSPTVVVPPTDANRSNGSQMEASPAQSPSRPPLIANTPRRERSTPPRLSKPPTQAKSQPIPPQPQQQPPTEETFADQPTGRQQVATPPPSQAQKSLRAKANTPAPAVATPPNPAAEPAPSASADAITSNRPIPNRQPDTAITESSSQESDRVNGKKPINHQQSLPQDSRNTPGNRAFSRLAPESSHMLRIRQYIKQRWQVPVGLTQRLQYQLTLNANGSLQQVNPLDKLARQYLGKVPLPDIGQPFISPLQPSQAPQVRLVLTPDGTIQTFVESNGK